MKERIVISSDHAGFELKEAVKAFLCGLGYETEDVGTYSTEPVDYPVYTYKAAQKVSSGECRRGIICCGTGQGDAIAANKVPGIRAALCWDTTTARLSRAHNDANMLVLGGWTTDRGLAQQIVRTWLDTPFDGGRHSRRLKQIKDIETSSRLQRRRIYDVSPTLYTGMPIWQGDPQVIIKNTCSIAEGDSYNVSWLQLGSHSGSHVDAPRHFLENAAGVDAVSPEALLGAARLLRLKNNPVIDRKTLGRLGLNGVCRLLLATGCSTSDFKYSYLTPDAADYLLTIGIRLLGTDCPSVDKPGDESYPVHHALLGGGVVILEGLDFRDVPAGDYELICAPLKIKDGDAAPARVFLREV
jgi:ribose 5-phosphate isomerase B